MIKTVEVWGCIKKWWVIVFLLMLSCEVSEDMNTTDHVLLVVNNEVCRVDSNGHLYKLSINPDHSVYSALWGMNGKKLLIESSLGSTNPWEPGLYSMDSSGKYIRPIMNRADSSLVTGLRPRLSQDGRRLLFSSYGDIWLYSFYDQKKINITNSEAFGDFDPEWVDEKNEYFIYLSSLNNANDGGFNVFRSNISGTIQRPMTPRNDVKFFSYQASAARLAYVTVKDTCLRLLNLEDQTLGDSLFLGRAISNLMYVKSIAWMSGEIRSVLIVARTSTNSKDELYKIDMMRKTYQRYLSEQLPDQTVIGSVDVIGLNEQHARL